MTHDYEKLIALAREAGFSITPPRAGEYDGGRVHSDVLSLKRFAELVRADERRKHQTAIESWQAEALQAQKWRGLALSKDPMQPGKVVQAIQEEAAAREREACALVCERRVVDDHNREDLEAQRCATAIRARSAA